MSSKYTDYNPDCIQEGQIPQEATIRLCCTIQGIIEAQINPKSNLIYWEPRNHDRRKTRSTRRTSFDLRVFEDVELAESTVLCAEVDVSEE